MSYGQKTVLTLEKFYKNRHNWGSRPSPGMILVGKLIILSSIDNLIKGGAGQAVQNLNFIYNFKFNEGLK